MPVYRDQFSPKVHSTGKKIILMLFSSTSQNKSDAIDLMYVKLQYYNDPSYIHIILRRQYSKGLKLRHENQELKNTF